MVQQLIRQLVGDQPSDVINIYYSYNSRIILLLYYDNYNDS